MTNRKQQDQLWDSRSEDGRYRLLVEQIVDYAIYMLDTSGTVTSWNRGAERFKGYTPTTLKLGPMTRLGGRMSKANVAFDDHPNDKRFSDRIETVTADSVFAWLQRSGLGAAPVTLGL